MENAMDDHALSQLNDDVRAHLSRLRTLGEHPELQASLTRWLDARLSTWCEFALLCSRLAGPFSQADLPRVVSAWLIMLRVAGPLDDDAAEGRGADRAWIDLGRKRGGLLARALIADATGLLLEDKDRPGLAAVASALLRHFQESALGQALSPDEVQTLDAYEHMLELKAATLTLALAESVAVLSGAESGPKQALVTCGQELGMALMVVKDYRGVWRETAAGELPASDLARPQMTYPVFYALTAPHAYQDEFRALLSKPPAERNTARMREIMAAIGVPKFMRDAVQQRTKRALQAAHEIAPEGTADLESWCSRHLAGEDLKDAH